MNGNLTTIDTTVKVLDARVVACEAFGTRIGALETDVPALEGVSNGGNINSASITNSELLRVWD